MSRGYTTIYLIGGSQDNECIEDVPLKRLPKSLSFQTQTYFAKDPSGDMVLMKGELNSLWHSYSVDVYEKAEMNSNGSGVTFEFSETKMIERCSAITKKGTQCKKPAIDGESYCCINHKQN